MAHPYDLLRAELARDGSRPFVTFYDDATGERVELSVATFDNWVAKTAGLLRDGLSAQPGDRVALLLPPHWQALVWACASWAVGTAVLLDPDAATSADVAVAVSSAAAARAPASVPATVQPPPGSGTATRGSAGASPPGCAPGRRRCCRRWGPAGCSWRPSRLSKRR